MENQILETPLQAYERSIKSGKKVSFWSKGVKVEEGIYHDIGNARLRAYSLNWAYKVEN